MLGSIFNDKRESEEDEEDKYVAPVYDIALVLRTHQTQVMQANVVDVDQRD